MEFSFDPALDAFREEVRTFLREHLPSDMAARGRRGYHPTRVDGLGWTQILAAKGWSAPHWPKEYGGTGWSALQTLVFEEECYAAGAPAPPPGSFALVAPVIYTFGTAEQKAKHLPPILRGEVYWGQGFSEPNSGSDLASLRTSARREGDHYIVNGHKTWTTEGHFSTWFFCLVRTDSTVKAQRGISFLLIDGATPGITVRPIITIDDGHSVNEVFFDEVRVPVEDRVGEEGMGWTYAKFLLDNERAWSAELPRNRRMFSKVRQLAAVAVPGGIPLLEDPAFITRLAQAEAELLALEFLTLRALSEHGTETRESWPAGSLLHIRGSELLQTLSGLMVEALGVYGMVKYPEFENEPPKGYPPGPPGAPGVVSDFLYRRATTIYGGSNEIQRNIIARGFLGL